MSVYRFKVAEGEPKEIQFLGTALNSMFMYEFTVNRQTDERYELVARSYTEDVVSDIRKPKLIRAASEVNNMYNLGCNIAEYEGYVAPAEVEPERFATVNDAIVTCNLDAYYYDFIMQGKDVKPDFAMQYAFIYGKKPTDEQLKVFTDFMCGRATMFDVDKVCGKDAEQSGQTGPNNN